MQLSASTGSTRRTVKPAGKPTPGARARPRANENYLLISAFAAANHSPLVAISQAHFRLRLQSRRSARRLARQRSFACCRWPAAVGCDRQARKRAGAARARRRSLRLAHFRTGAKQQQSNLLPYVVEVVAADKPGVLFQLAEFFARQGITIEQLHSTRYRAMQTGADMFSAQITIGIPTRCTSPRCATIFSNSATGSISTRSWTR